MRVGNVVKALAGKEKEQLFVIVRIDDKYAYISDGKRLKVNKPKKKSFKHICLIGSQSLGEDFVLDQNERVNAKVRKFLSNIRSEHV